VAMNAPDLAATATSREKVRAEMQKNLVLEDIQFGKPFRYPTGRHQV